MEKTITLEVHIAAPPDISSKLLDEWAKKGYYISSIRKKDQFTILYELTLNAG